MGTERSTGELAGLLGTIALSAFGAGIAIWVVTHMAIGAPPPLSLFVYVLGRLAPLLWLCALLAAIGSFVVGLAALITDADRRQAASGMAKGSVVVLLPTVLFLVVLLLFLTSDQPLFG